MKIEDKSRRCTYKNTHISLANCPRVPTLYQIRGTTQSVVSVLGYPNYLILIVTNINENMKS